MVDPSTDRDTTFSSEAIQVLADAFEHACSTLGIPEDAYEERDLIAERIIELASGGVIDAVALCDRVVSEAKGESGQVR